MSHWARLGLTMASAIYVIASGFLLVSVAMDTVFCEGGCHGPWTVQGVVVWVGWILLGVVVLPITAAALVTPRSPVKRPATAAMMAGAALAAGLAVALFMRVGPPAA